MSKQDLQGQLQVLSALKIHADFRKLVQPWWHLIKSIIKKKKNPSWIMESKRQTGKKKQMLTDPQGFQCDVNEP